MATPWPLPRLAVTAAVAEGTDRAKVTFTVTNAKPTATEATIDPGGGAALLHVPLTGGTGTVTYTYPVPGHRTYTVTATAPCKPWWTTWTQLPGDAPLWTDVPDQVATWEDTNRSEETAITDVTVDVGRASIWAEVIPGTPPYIQVNTWIGDAGTVTGWTVTRIAPDAGGDQNVPIMIRRQSSGGFVLEDREAPLGVPVMYRLDVTYATGAPFSVTSLAVAITDAYGCYLTDTSSGATVPVQVQAWDTRTRAPRQSVLAVLGRADPVVISDIHTTPAGTWVFLTRTRAQMEAVYDVLLRSRLVLLRTQPESSLRTTYGAVGEIEERRLSEGDGRDWHRLMSVAVQEIAPIPATARALGTRWDQVPVQWGTWEALAADMPSWLDVSQWNPDAPGNGPVRGA